MLGFRHDPRAAFFGSSTDDGLSANRANHQRTVRRKGLSLVGASGSFVVHLEGSNLGRPLALCLVDVFDKLRVQARIDILDLIHVLVSIDLRLFGQLRRHLLLLNASARSFELELMR